MIITEPLVRKLLATVDAGLTAGVGVPEPGKMCVEAAISFALGEPHSDGPSCVDAAVRAGKITLNDCSWSSDMARANGMRRVAIAQLGSKGTIDPVKYVRLLAQYTMEEIVPLVAKYAQSSQSSQSAKYAMSAQSSQSAKYAAGYAAKSAWSAGYAGYARYAAGYAADSAAESAGSAGYAKSDIALRLSAELMVRALRECGSPGCEWLWLCDEIEASS